MVHTHWVLRNNGNEDGFLVVARHKHSNKLFWNCYWVCEYSACGKGDIIAGWWWTSKRGGVSVACKGLDRQIPPPASCGERTKPPSVVSQDDAIWDLPNKKPNVSDRQGCGAGGR